MTDTSGAKAMRYKDALYKSYVTTHLAHRKSIGDPAVLRAQARAFGQHFGRFLPPDRNARIADLGCGSGGLVWWLRRAGYANAVGVDTSAEQIAIAHKLGIESVAQGDVFEFLTRSRGFDVLFARDLLEHFDKQGVFDFLELCFASLTPGGSLILQVPNAESPYFGRVRYGDFTHEIAFTASSITQILGAVGFEAIRVRPWRPAIAGFGSLVRHLAWRLMEPLLKLPLVIEGGRRERIMTSNLIAAATRVERSPGAAP